MKIRSYRELTVWQAGMKLVEKIYRLTRNFPKQETFAHSVQIQRAAVSIPSNIAEGHARDSTREFLHHISITLGSLAELETQLMLADRLAYVGRGDLQLILSDTDELGKMLRGMQKALRAKLAPKP